MNIGITGIGGISAAGSDPQEVWRTYTEGPARWAMDPSTHLPVYPAQLPSHAGIEAFSAERDLDRATLLALYAADRAVAQAGWRGEDFSVLVGSSRGPTGSWEAGFQQFSAAGRVGPRTSPATTLGSIGFGLGAYFSSASLASSLSVTCSSGLHALLHGVALLRAGMASRVLVGGAEAPLTPFTLRQMEALRIYAAPPEDDRLPVCRPLAQPATGMVVGEGAAFLALELDSAQPPIARITGLAFAREVAGSPTGITPTGEGLQKTMREAAATAGKSPDLIIAHAPGTRQGDAAELFAIRQVFGPEQAVTSGKWATGHTFGASGPLALELAIAILRAGDAAGLAYMPGGKWVRSVLVNATGFGGNVVSVFLE